MAAFTDLVESGHRHIFATIVREPIHNIAAVPFLEGAGGRIIGTIDEHYPSIGRILSTLYHIDATIPLWTNPQTATRVRAML
jgi:hypothetical protein